MKTNKATLLLYLLFLATPFFDSFHGLLVGKGIVEKAFVGSPSQMIRFFILCYSVYLITVKSKIDILLLLTLFLVFLEVFIAIFHQTLGGLLIGITFAFKIVYAFSIYYAINLLLSKNLINIDIIFNYILKATLIISAIIIIPKILGIELPTYDEDYFASKGFFASANGLSPLLGTQILLVIYSNKDITKNYINIIAILAGTLALVFIGNKGAMIYAAIIFIFVFFKLRTWQKGVYLACFGLLIYIFWDTIQALFLLIFNVIAYRFYNNPEFLSFLASNRDNKILYAFNHADFGGFNIIRLIIGYGAYLSFRNVNESNFIYSCCENDFFDIFYSYGLLGITIYLFIVFKGMYLSLKVINLQLLIIWSLAMGYSFIAGHMVFNGMSIAAIVIVYTIINQNYCNLKQILKNQQKHSLHKANKLNLS